MIAILILIIILFIAILGTPLFSVIASIAIVNFTNSGSNTSNSPSGNDRNCR